MSHKVSSLRVVFGAYFIEGSVGLGEEGGEGIFISTHLKMFCHDTVGHLQGQGEGEGGALLCGFPVVLKLLHKSTA